MLSELQAVTEEHGYKVLVRTGPGRYHWGTCIREEYVNPLTNRRKVISATWVHSRGEVTHRSFATQTNSDNSDEFVRDHIIKHTAYVDKSVGGHFIDTNLLRNASTSTDVTMRTVSIEIQAEPAREQASSQATQADLLQESFEFFMIRFYMIKLYFLALISFINPYF